MNNLIDLLIRFAIILGIVIIIYLIWAIVWRALYLPIQKKDELLKEREEARNDLLEIQAAKSIEWDKYKELQDEIDKLRKIHFKDKEATEKLKEEVAKLQVDKEKILAYNKKLKEDNNKS